MAARIKKLKYPTSDAIANINKQIDSLVDEHNIQIPHLPNLINLQAIKTFRKALLEAKRLIQALLHHENQQFDI